MSTPKRYRKKPVVIEAMQMPADGAPTEGMAVYHWIEDNTLGSFEPMDRIEGRKPWPESGVSIDPRDGRMVIATLEGGHWVDLGDYVIRGVAGEFYPCKPDIFRETYESEEDQMDQTCSFCEGTTDDLTTGGDVAACRDCMTEGDPHVDQ